MKRTIGTYCFCLGMLLVMGAMAGSLTAQTGTQPAPPPPPAALGSPAAPVPPAAQGAPAQNGTGLDFSTEQFEKEMRTLEQELGSEVGDVAQQAAEIVKEAAMSSPGLEKLRNFSAQMEGERRDIEARAEELSARAEEFAREITQEVEEKAGKVFVEGPGFFVDSTEEGSGWLGIEIGEVTAEKAKDLKLAGARGVIVTDIEPDGPAAKAGLKENDVIVQYDGQAVEGTVQFRRLVRETPPGRTVGLGISRDGAAQNLSVELGDRSAYFEKKMKGKMRDFGGMNVPVMPGMQMPEMPEGMDMRTPVLGISAEDLTGQLGAFFGAPDNAGVLVREVRSGTPAEKAGLKAGDVIVKVGEQAVRSLGELREQLRAKSDQKTVSLGILRKGAEMSVTVGIEAPRPPAQMRGVHRLES